MSETLGKQVDIGRLEEFLAIAGPKLRKLTFRREGGTRVPPSPSASRLIELLRQISTTLPAARAHGDQVDIWSIVGLGRDEVQTTRVLTWLLDPRGSHGAGDAYLQGLWRHIDGSTKLGFSLQGARQAVRENYPLANLSNRIDIEVTGERFLLFIEAKIGAPEGHQQLERYSLLARAKAASIESASGGTVRVDWAVLYLTLGRMSAHRENFLHMGWQDVAQAIRRTCRQLDRTSFSSRVALSFASHVARL